MLLPEHYELMDDGVVVFKLENGESLSLTADHYLIMEDGLLLVTDELALASVDSLPVMGSIRAQLLSDIPSVATIDDTVAEATPSQALAITQGTAPRLSEQVDLQTYEIAQSSDGTSNEVREAVAVGLTVSPGAMVLLSMLMTEGEQPPEFWSDSMVANSASTAITGSGVDSYLGYTSASTTAVDWLSNVGRGTGNVATFDMSAGGDNYGQFGEYAGGDGGSLKYIGGPGNDVLTFDEYYGEDGGTIDIDLSAGGDNSLTFYDEGSEGALFTVVMGDGDDRINFADTSEALDELGELNIDMGGGNNYFFGGGDFLEYGDSYQTGAYTLKAGNGNDTFIFEQDPLTDGGSLTIDLGNGENSLTFLDGGPEDDGVVFAYIGGNGRDTIKISDDFGQSDISSVSLDLGADVAEDTIHLSVGGEDTEFGEDASDPVQIINFDPDHDMIFIPGYASTASFTLAAANGGADTLITTPSGSNEFFALFSGVTTGEFTLSVAATTVTIS